VLLVPVPVQAVLLALGPVQVGLRVVGVLVACLFPPKGSLSPTSNLLQ
jgi:hypothetical protein